MTSARATPNIWQNAALTNTIRPSAARLRMASVCRSNRSRYLTSLSLNAQRRSSSRSIVCESASGHVSGPMGRLRLAPTSRHAAPDAKDMPTRTAVASGCRMAIAADISKQLAIVSCHNARLGCANASARKCAARLRTTMNRCSMGSICVVNFGRFATGPDP